MNAVECILKSTPERTGCKNNNGLTIESRFSTFKPVDDDDDIFLMQIPKIIDESREISSPQPVNVKRKASVPPVNAKTYSLRQNPKRKRFDHDFCEPIARLNCATDNRSIDEDFSLTGKRKRRKIGAQMNVEDEECPEAALAMNYRFDCDLCNFRTSTSAALVCHSKKHSPKTEYYSCFVCYRSFAVKKERNKHIEEVHKDKETGSYICQCKKRFEEFLKLQTHCRYLHTLKFHKCQICEKMFKRIDKLKLHVATHDKFKRDFLCCHCGLTFRRMDKLRDHEKKHQTSANDEGLMEKTSKRRKIKHVFAVNSSPVKRTDFIEDNAVFKSPARPPGSLSEIQAMTPREFSTLLEPISNAIRVEPDSNGYSADIRDDDTCVFKCDICSTTFKRHGMFKNHMKLNHPNVDLTQLSPYMLPVLKSRTKYRCPYCPSYEESSTFLNMKRLVAHVNHYHGGRSLDLTKSNVKVKVTSVVSSTVKCKFCNLGEYINQWKLFEHVKDKHPDKIQPTNKIAEFKLKHKVLSDMVHETVFNNSFDVIEMCAEGIGQCGTSPSQLDNSLSVYKAIQSLDRAETNHDVRRSVSNNPSSFLPNLAVHNQQDLLTFSVPINVLGQNSTSSSVYQRSVGSDQFSVRSAPQPPKFVNLDNFNETLARPFTPATPLPVSATFSAQLVTPQFSLNFSNGEHTYTLVPFAPSMQSSF